MVSEVLVHHEPKCSRDYTEVNLMLAGARGKGSMTRFVYVHVVLAGGKRNTQKDGEGEFRA